MKVCVCENEESIVTQVRQAENRSMHEYWHSTWK